MATDEILCWEILGRRSGTFSRRRPRRPEPIGLLRSLRSPQRVNQVELRELVQVEGSRGEAGDQDASRLVEGGRRQVVKVALLVEEVSEGAEESGRFL